MIKYILILLIFCSCAASKNYCQINFDNRASQEATRLRIENEKLNKLCDKLQGLVWELSESLDECSGNEAESCGQDKAWNEKDIAIIPNLKRFRKLTGD